MRRSADRRTRSGGLRRSRPGFPLGGASLQTCPRTRYRRGIEGNDTRTKVQTTDRARATRRADALPEPAG